jgi:hypothetical protein
MTINSRLKTLQPDPNSTFVNNTLLNNTFINNNDINAQSTQANYLNKKSLLVNDFGTSKSKKVVESMMSNIVKEENISSANAINDIIQKKSKIIEEKNLNQSITNDQEASLKSILPEYNLETNKTQEMFNVNSSKTNFFIFLNNKLTIL